jgi:hypothetical protein
MNNRNLPRHWMVHSSLSADEPVNQLPINKQFPPGTNFNDSLSTHGSRSNQ